MDKRILAPDIQRFILEHGDDDPAVLALRYREINGVPIGPVIGQIRSRRISALKAPTWLEIPGIYFPPPVSMEQCSSWETARYKDKLARSRQVTDLTGGAGMDSLAFAQAGRRVDYVERDQELCRIAEHNFSVAGFGHIRIFQNTAEEYLERMEAAELVFLDPSRRNDGQRVFSLRDSEPDVSKLWKDICEASSEQLVKLSPMVDLNQVVRDLEPGVRFIMLSVRGELKEVLVYRNGKEPAPSYQCIDLNSGSESEFSFTGSEEREHSAELSDPGAYIFEPNASIMKSGGFNTLSVRMNLPKLAPNTHLYTAGQMVDDFPGRCFRLLGIYTARSFPSALKKANVSVRNFPITAPELKKKLGLRDGGPDHVMGCTLSDGSHRLLHLERID